MSKPKLKLHYAICDDGYWALYAIDLDQAVRAINWLGFKDHNYVVSAPVRFVGRPTQHGVLPNNLEEE